MSLLDVKNLKTYFHTRAGTTRAVDDVSFSIDKKEIVGVVGESGSGKSVTCHTMLGLLPQPPAKVEGGSVAPPASASRLQARENGRRHAGVACPRAGPELLVRAT